MIVGGGQVRVRGGQVMVRWWSGGGQVVDKWWTGERQHLYIEVVGEESEHGVLTDGQAGVPQVTVHRHLQAR